jgi:hypothetical protein
MASFTHAKIQSELFDTIDAAVLDAIDRFNRANDTRFTPSAIIADWCEAKERPIRYPSLKPIYLSDRRRR